MQNVLVGMVLIFVLLKLKSDPMQILSQILNWQYFDKQNTCK
jgi:hypothetical protein